MAHKIPKPESFSDQLRRAVRESGTTGYALAKQVGVSESTLSRFLTGERGLSLDLLDRMADVLGLRVIVTVQKAARPTRRGPKPKREKPMTSKGPPWAEYAEALAQDAHENYFPSRRGIWRLENENKLCIYNNHPYSSDPALRDEETDTFRDWLAAHGIEELGYATYPDTGEGAGYTYAMIIDAELDREAEVTEALRRILFESIDNRHNVKPT